MAKKRSPQDATVRNVKASQKRDDKLARKVAKLEQRIGGIECFLADLVDLIGLAKQ